MSGGVFWSVGPKAHRVPLSLWADNRTRLCEALRSAEPFSGPPGVALLQGGVAVQRHDTDHEELFRQESFFAWLTGVQEPGFSLALNLDTGEATLFCPRLPASYAVWMGPVEPAASFAARYGVERCLYSDELPAFVADAPRLRLLCGVNTDSGASSTPAPVPAGYPADRVDTGAALHTALVALRSIKTASEVALMRHVVAVTSRAHVAVMRLAKPGMAEYELEAAFLHHIYAFGGCRRASYTCICAVGSHAAVLHYGHAGAPNDGLLAAGQLALLDMGAEYGCYGADVTCTFPVGGSFTPDGRALYVAVLRAQAAALAMMRPGVEWAEVHRCAEAALLRGLADAGLLAPGCGAEAAAAARLGAVFMPHGLGHLLGVDTHDVGGYPLGGAGRLDEPGLRSLRMNRRLEAGMVVTVEPGCYFIEPLLAAARADPAQARLVDWDAVRCFAPLGGCRLEDDVLVTADGVENLTQCPREPGDVEAVMAGAPWPPAATV